MMQTYLKTKMITIAFSGFRKLNPENKIRRKTSKTKYWLFPKIELYYIQKEGQGGRSRETEPRTQGKIENGCGSDSEATG